MTDEALSTLKANALTANNYLKTNKNDSQWIREIYDGKLYIEKKQKINDFELKVSPTGDYSEVDFQNSIILYENLKDLPPYILSDERFWAWLNFEKFLRKTTSGLSTVNPQYFHRLLWIDLFL